MPLDFSTSITPKVGDWVELTKTPGGKENRIVKVEYYKQGYLYFRNGLFTEGGQPQLEGIPLEGSIEAVYSLSHNDQTGYSQFLWLMKDGDYILRARISVRGFKLVGGELQLNIGMDVSPASIHCYKDFHTLIFKEMLEDMFLANLDVRLEEL